MTVLAVLVGPDMQMHLIGLRREPECRDYGESSVQDRSSTSVSSSRGNPHVDCAP
jgi:hypothetical protein